MSKSQRSRLFIFFATAIFITAGTFLMIRFAQGYRLDKTGTIKGTGLLAANSFPTGAEVYIADKLTTATDNTLNLDPGTYTIEIKKDGFHPWKKTLTIEAELVTQTNATLFPTSPSLEPLTFTGALNPVPSPDGSKIVFAVASASAVAKNGLYIQELGNSPLDLNRSARQIARTTRDFDYTTARYTWSPNGSEILVAFPTGAHVLLESHRFNDLASLQDVTVTLPQTLREWELELARKQEVRLRELPDFFTQIATSSATNLYFSPDGHRLLYQATASFEIPPHLAPPLPASSTQPESRQVESDSWYVYDLKEDRNFLVSSGISPEASSSGFLPQKLLLVTDLDTQLPPAELGILTAATGSPSAFRRLQTEYTLDESLALFNAQYSPIFTGHIQWFPDSTHLILTSDSGIEIVEYDGTNRVTIYAGPFDHNFVYSWPDASRLVTRIQFSPDTTPNLYTIKLK